MIHAQAPCDKWPGQPLSNTQRCLVTFLTLRASRVLFRLWHFLIIAARCAPSDCFFFRHCTNYLGEKLYRWSPSSLLPPVCSCTFSGRYSRRCFSCPPWSNCVRCVALKCNWGRWAQSCWMSVGCLPKETHIKMPQKVPKWLAKLQNHNSKPKEDGRAGPLPPPVFSPSCTENQPRFNSLKQGWIISESVVCVGK